MCLYLPVSMLLYTHQFWSLSFPNNQQYKLDTIIHIPKVIPDRIYFAAITVREPIQRQLCWPGPILLPHPGSPHTNREGLKFLNEYQLFKGTKTL